MFQRRVLGAFKIYQLPDFINLDIRSMPAKNFPFTTGNCYFFFDRTFEITWGRQPTTGSFIFALL